MVSIEISTLRSVQGPYQLIGEDFRNARIEQLARDDKSTTDSTISHEDGDIDQDLVLAGKRFDKDLHRIQGYFRTLVRTQITEGPKDNEKELLRRKHALLIEYDTITAFEKDVDTPLALGMFAVSLAMYVLQAVSLFPSIPDPGNVITFVLCYIGTFGLRIYSIICTVIEILLLDIQTRNRSGGAPTTGARDEAHEVSDRRSHDGSQVSLIAMTVITTQRADQFGRDHAASSL